MMRAVLLACAVLLASLGLTACTTDDDPATNVRTESERPDKSKGGSGKSTEDPTEDPEPDPDPEPDADGGELTVVASNFGQQPYDTTTWWYAAIVNNPSDRVYEFAEVTVEAIGADGTILETSSNYVNLLPGDAAITGIFFEMGDTAIDHLEIRGPSASDSEPAPDGLGTFSVSEIAPTTDEYATTVSGILSGTFTEEQENVEVVIVASDPAGTIIGAEYTYVDRLPVDGRVRFEVRFWDPLPDGTTYAAYPMF